MSIQYTLTPIYQGNAEDERRLQKIDPKWVEKLHVIDKINDGNTNGFLDIQGGVTIADKVTSGSQTIVYGARILIKVASRVFMRGISARKQVSSLF